MRELSLHIIDIIQNSIVAGATLITVELIEDPKNNILEISIEDNGKGMSEELINKVLDPFTTSRTTRKVGLGLPLFKQAAQMTGGNLVITSTPKVSTKVTATFVYDHIDRQPVGDMADTMLGTIISHEDIDFVYRHVFEAKEFTIKTQELKEILGGVSFSEPDVYMWLKEYLKEAEGEILN